MPARSEHDALQGLEKSIISARAIAMTRDLLQKEKVVAEDAGCNHISTSVQAIMHAPEYAKYADDAAGRDSRGS